MQEGPPLDPFTLAPRDTKSVTRVDVTKLHGLEGGDFVLDLLLFGTQHAMRKPNGACSGPSASWIQEMYVFRSDPNATPLVAIRVKEDGSERAACWSKLTTPWIPTRVAERAGFQRGDRVVAAARDWVLEGSRENVEAGLARIDSPPEATSTARHAVFEREVLVTSLFQGPFSTKSAVAGWEYVDVNPHWVTSSVTWQFQTTDDASQWLARRTDDLDREVAPHRATVSEGTNAGETLNLPLDPASAMRVSWTLYHMIRSGTASYLASSRPCAPVSAGTASPANIRSLSEHARGATQCYQELLARDPNMHGKLLVELQVETDRRVCYAKVVESGVDDPTFHACVVGSLRSWSAPESPDGSLLFRVPLSFRPRQAAPAQPAP
jgi:hypothetical protein